MHEKIRRILALTAGATFTTYAQKPKAIADRIGLFPKKVQRTRFKTALYEPAQIRTGNADWAIAKSVHRIQKAPEANKK